MSAASEHNIQSFRLIFENSPAIMLLIDSESERIVAANKAAKDFYGWKTSEMETMSYNDIITLPVEKIEEEKKKTRQSKHNVLRLKHRLASGEERNVEVYSGQVEIDGKKYVHAIVHDITECKQVEGYIQKNEERLREAEMIGKIGHVDWIVAEQRSYWSDEIFRIYERDPGMGVPTYEEIMSLHEPEDAARLEKAVVDALQKGKDYDLDLVAVMPSGKKKYLHIIGKPVKDAQGAVTNIRGIVQDITERRKAEEEMRKSEEKLQSIFRVAPTGIGLVKNRTLIEVNPKICEMTGYQPHELINKNARILYPSQKEFEFVGREKYALINKHGTGIVETRWKKKDGTIINILLASTAMDVNDLSKGVIYTALDITERKKTSDELLEMKNRYQGLFENSLIGIGVATPKGKIIEVNKAFLDMLGYKYNEIKSIDIIDLYKNPEDRDSIIKTLKQKNTLVDFETKLIRKDGVVIDVLLNITLVKIKGRKFYQTSCQNITDRKQAEETLRASEMRFKEILKRVETVAVQGYTLDGTVTYWNSASARYYGYTEQEALGKNLLDLIIPPEMQDEVRSAIRQMAGTEQAIPSSELLLMRKDGSRIPVYSSHSFVKIPGKEPELFCIDVDMSQHKQAEEALKQSASQFRQLIETLPISLSIVTVSGEILYVNPKCRELFEIEENYRSRDAFFHWIDAEDRKRWLKEIEEKGAVRNFEMHLRTATGKEIWALGSGLLVQYENQACVLSTQHDITEVKYTQDALRESEVKYRTLVNNTLQGVVIAKSDPVRLVFVNPAMTNICGYAFEELIGMGPEQLEKLIHEEDRQRFFSSFQKRLQGEDIPQQSEYRIKMKDGDIKWVDLYSSRIEYLNEPATLTTFMDITARKRVEQELVKAKEKAEESDKLKTAFINNISHEIRTPLNVILGFGEILSKSDISAEERMPLFKRAQQSSHRLMNTISDYMDMAMIVSGTMVTNIKAFALRPLFEEIAGEAKKFCNEKNINFKTEIPFAYEDVIIHSDPGFIRKILGKLIDNALKFTPEGCITCGYNIKGKYIEFFVRDTGYGISSDKLEMIFDMFGQEDTSMIRGYEGSGLGLTISRGLVLQLGGEINVVSEKDKGSVFTFTIPTGKLKKPVSAGTPEKIKKASKKKPLILIAEDDESNYKYMITVLQLCGYDYILAVNGLEAVEFCQQDPEIDIVLMDIKMPEMDGIEATRKIRELRPEIPIIATTAYAQTGDKQRFLSAGCNAYLAKPIKKEELMAMIKKYTEVDL